MKIFFYKLLEVLKAGNYSLEKTIEICEKHEKKFAVAYIYERCGEIDKAY